MTRNPYYWMAGRNGSGPRLALATLRDAGRGTFLVEGRRTAMAGRAAGLTLRESDEGKLFLCAGDESGWYLLLRLEEL